MAESTSVLPKLTRLQNDLQHALLIGLLIDQPQRVRVRPTSCRSDVDITGNGCIKSLVPRLPDTCGKVKVVPNWGNKTIKLSIGKLSIQI